MNAHGLPLHNSKGARLPLRKLFTATIFVIHLYDRALHYHYQVSPTSPSPVLAKGIVLGICHLLCTWRDGLVVSALDQRQQGRGFESVGCRLLCSNRGPVALCTLGLGLLNPPSSWGR